MLSQSDLNKYLTVYPVTEDGNGHILNSTILTVAYSLEIATDRY